MHVVLKSYYSGLFSFTIPTAHLTKRVVFFHGADHVFFLLGESNDLKDAHDWLTSFHDGEKITEGNTLLRNIMFRRRNFLSILAILRIKTLLVIHEYIKLQSVV